mmetsp:Transcript_60566/g.118741  ORF Transcript_60566/g.118741 Transcript_60566/m.118741 type:complete len:590 (-) Transcript_60566:46-1815(-)
MRHLGGERRIRQFTLRNKLTTKARFVFCCCSQLNKLSWSLVVRSITRQTPLANPRCFRYSLSVATLAAQVTAHFAHAAFSMPMSMPPPLAPTVIVTKSSPALNKPCSFAAAKASCFGSSVGNTPRCKLVWRATLSACSAPSNKRSTGADGRYLLTSLATSPVTSPFSTMHPAPSFSDVNTADAAVASSFDSAWSTIASRLAMVGIHSSVFAMILFIMATDSTGNLPLADSPESITASAPSSTALVTSLTSARVGRGFFCMDSSIWVATITGFPEASHRCTISFCQITTSSRGTSTPRSPRATIMPSEASVISSKFSSASVDSTLAMILAWGLLSGQNSAWQVATCARISSTSLALRTNEAATKSTSFSTPYRMCSLSKSDMAGRSTAMPGKFTPRRLAISPSFSTLHSTPLELTSLTVNAMAPSSSSTVFPTVQVFSRVAYVTNMVLASLHSLNAGSLVSSISAPVFTWIFAFTSPLSFTAWRFPVRISGPLVSKRTVRSIPLAPSKGNIPVVFDSELRRRTTSSSVAWLKFRRITCMPACVTLGSVSASSDTGPMVATILVNGTPAMPRETIGSELREAAIRLANNII